MGKRVFVPAFFVQICGFKEESMTSASSVNKEVTRLIEPIIEDMGFELVDVRYVSQQGRSVLRIFVDKEGGISIDDCAHVSREIGELIDVKDIIDHAYVLEVSSPGLDRPLVKEKDFQKAIGKKIKVKTAVQIGNRKNFMGYLRGVNKGGVSLEVENDKMVLLKLGNVVKANIVYEFEN